MIFFWKSKVRDNFGMEPLIPYYFDCTIFPILESSFVYLSLQYHIVEFGFDDFPLPETLVFQEL